MRNLLRARLAQALDRRFGALAQQTAELRDSVEAGRGELGAVRDEIAGLRGELASIAGALVPLHADLHATGSALGQLRDTLDDEVVGLLRELLIDDAGNRRRLEELRAGPDYARPYETADPLVSICIATRPGRTGLLIERAIASALAQTHENIEVVVVGDGFDPRDDSDVGALDDPRLRFGAVTHHLVDADPGRAWLVAATLPRQEARSLADGMWITDLDDDDALRPDAVESLLALARSERAEVASGLLAQHRPGDEDPTLIAGTPPEFVPEWSGLPGEWRSRACTAALWHQGLRSFTRIRAAALLGVPGDLFLTIRLARAGARFAILERVVYDYYPGLLWEAARETPPGAG